MVKLKRINYKVLETYYDGSLQDVVVNPRTNSLINTTCIISIEDEMYTEKFLRGLASRNRVITRLKSYAYDKISYQPYAKEINPYIKVIPVHDPEMTISKNSICNLVLATVQNVLLVPSCLILDRTSGGDFTIFGYLHQQMTSQFK